MQATLFGELEGFEVAKPRIPDCEPWHDFEKSQKEKKQEQISWFAPVFVKKCRQKWSI